MSNRCRGCTEGGWQGLVNGETGERLHERTTAPGERDVIPCTAGTKKKSLFFKKVCRGLYMNHEHGMSVAHELVWDKSVGRRWVAEWQESYMGLMVPSVRTRKFDSMQEAREFLNNLLENKK